MPLWHAIDTLSRRAGLFSSSSSFASSDSFFFLGEITDNVVLGSLTVHIQSVTLAQCGHTLVTSPTHSSPLCERALAGARCELCNMNAAIISIFKPFCYRRTSHKLGGRCNLSGGKKTNKVWVFLIYLEGICRRKQNNLERLQKGVRVAVFSIYTKGYRCSQPHVQFSVQQLYRCVMPTGEVVKHVHSLSWYNKTREEHCRSVWMRVFNMCSSLLGAKFLCSCSLSNGSDYRF